MLRPFVGLGLALGVTLLACGGTVILPDQGSSGSSGGSTSSGGTSSGGSTSSSGGTSSGDPACRAQTLPGDRVCVPGVALAELPITVAVDSVDGCLPCDTALTPCQVTVSGTLITLSMQGLTCQVHASGCEEVCGNVTETCTIPPLPAGTYTVDIAGADRSSGFRPRDLVVGDDPTSSGCTLPPKGTLPAPLDGSKYSTACSTDTDCTTVLAGNVCSSCGCANTAIAVSDKDRYEADYRAASSQCEPSLPTPCPFCAAPAAFCVVSPDALVGTCSVGKL